MDALNLLRRLFRPADADVAAPPLAGQLVLLAEESAFVRKILPLVLEQEGCRVVTVADGRQVIEQVSAKRPTLVVASTTLPGLTGYELCRIIKGRDDLRDVRVVLTNNASGPFDAALARRVGCDAELPKPSSAVTTLDRIRELVTGKQVDYRRHPTHHQGRVGRSIIAAILPLAGVAVILGAAFSETLGASPAVRPALGVIGLLGFIGGPIAAFVEMSKHEYAKCLNCGLLVRKSKIDSERTYYPCGKCGVTWTCACSD